ncbi:Amino-acid permease inda1 [Paramarasmius palmivorus]|uniref:Amino-acid permease inda1 n=1 Tax=Paramarasmius palmivorus TaxID=297713 RepID=A0AAW0EGI8_9AGAR
MEPVMKEKLDSASSTSSHHIEFYDPSKESIWTRLGVNLESFKRAPGSTGGQVVVGDLSDVDRERLKAEGPMLQQKMKPRHLSMIAVGGSIGTGLFVGSGSALHRGGPAGVLIAWILIGMMLINVTQALGEMAIVYPVSGGFYTLSDRFIDPGFAFAMGWNYVLQWIVVVPLEVTVAVTTVNYWPAAQNFPVAGWITIFWIVLGPSDGDYSSYIGGLHWKDPGAFANGFQGVCSVFVTAAFSFAGTEIVGLAASETPDPRKTMPAAVKGTFWRITLIYITSLTIIGLLLPYTEERLLGGGGAASSPFVIALDRARIPGLNHLINVTICISVLSIGLSSVYAGSRTLTALAENGYAPRIFTYVDKSSRPLWSVVLFLISTPIAYIQTAEDGATVFDWLVAISALSTLITWLSICICHLRFRRAWKVQGHSVEELPFKALGGEYGSWFGVILIVLVLIAQFYVAIWPPNFEGTSGDRVASFFQAYMAAPIIIGMWVAGYAWKRTRPRRAHEIDLDTGRKSWLTVEDMRQYRAERAAAPFYVRIYRILFTN